MRRSILFCLMATLIVTLTNATRHARGEHFSSVTVHANGAEGGGGESKTRPRIASVDYSNPDGGSGSASASVGPETIIDSDFEHPGKIVLAMKAFATATGGSGEQQYMNNVASANVFWEEDMRFKYKPFPGVIPEFEPEPLEQALSYLQFMYRMNGSNSGDTFSRFDFSVTHNDKSVIEEKDLNAFDQDFSNVPMYVYADDLELISMSGSIDLNMSFTLHVAAVGHGSAFGLPQTSTADFSHTVSLVSITPFDAQGNVIPGVMIEAASDFDYNPLIVPEPSGLTLIGLGLFGLFIRRGSLVSR